MPRTTSTVTRASLRPAKTARPPRRTVVALATSFALAAVVAGGAVAFATEPRAGDVPEVTALAEGALENAETQLDAAHDDVDTDDLQDLIVQVEGFEELPAGAAQDLVGELAVASAHVWADTAAAEAVDAAQQRLAEQTATVQDAWAATLKEQRAEAERIAEEKAAAEALARVNTVDGAKAAARTMAAETYGWGDGEFSCLDSLWTKESGWNHQAMNPSSGAYGIPQSLPGSKMASVGADWQTNAATQIAWGLEYIAAVYGSPCAAWGHSQATDWY